MNIHAAEIKNDLHRLIVETDDVSILNKVQAYFATLRSKKIDWWDSVSTHERKTIETGLQQLQNGDKIPYGVVQKKVNKLLGRE